MIDMDKFILSALVEYNNEKDEDKKSALYEQTMSVLRANAQARSQEGK